MKEGAVDLQLALVADNQPAEVAHPGESWLPLPAAPVATQLASVLDFAAVAAPLGCDQLDSAVCQTLAPGQEYELPRLRLNLAGRTVRGWVGDEEQNAVPGARVLATDCDSVAEVGADGCFQLDGLPMEDTVWIVGVHPTKSLYAAVELDPDWRFEPGLILKPPGTLTGQIQDAAGNPISALRVQLYSQHFGYSVEPWLPPGTRQTAVTDAEGKFSFSGLIGGLEYVIYARETDPNVYVGSHAMAQPGETVDLGTITAREWNVP